MKEKNTAIILAIFLGGIGAHKFYLERPAQGIIYLLFCWTFIPAVVGFIEGICYISYSQERWDREFNDNAIRVRVVEGPSRDQKKCPDCAELILAEAKKCKHCGSSMVA